MQAQISTPQETVSITQELGDFDASTVTGSDWHLQELDLSAPQPTTSVFQGDLDKDGDVDIFDYNILIENFRATNCGNVADINSDCKVDIFDYNLLVGNFGKKG